MFHADSVLAKHDENYMPPEVAKKLKEQGVWRGDEQAGARKADGNAHDRRDRSFALILALAVAIVQTVLPIWGTRRRDPQLMADRGAGGASCSSCSSPSPSRR